MLARCTSPPLWDSPYAIVGNDGDGVGAGPVRLWLPRCANVTRSVALPAVQIVRTIVIAMTTVLWRGIPA